MNLVHFYGASFTSGITHFGILCVCMDACACACVYMLRIDQDEIGLKEWALSLRSAHKRSQELLGSMARKAGKIYGTERDKSTPVINNNTNTNTTVLGGSGSGSGSSTPNTKSTNGSN